MKEFVWHRRNFHIDEYKDKMNINDSQALQKPIEKNDKLKQAYETACEIRKFEIELFWKRAGFFWAFIAAIYTAYFNVLIKIYPFHKPECPPYQHGKIPLLVLSALGLFFCFAWLLSSYGSKHWQENWENHIDLLEDNVTGPLYKIYDAGQSYSESRLTIAAGWMITICAYSLLIFEFICFVQTNFAKKGILAFVIVLSFSLIILLLMYIFKEIMKGNQNKSGKIEFQIKEYEWLNV